MYNQYTHNFFVLFLVAFPKGLQYIVVTIVKSLSCWWTSSVTLTTVLTSPVHGSNCCLMFLWTVAVHKNQSAESAFGSYTFDFLLLCKKVRSWDQTDGGKVASCLFKARDSTRKNFCSFIPNTSDLTLPPLTTLRMLTKSRKNMFCCSVLLFLCFILMITFLR